MKTAHQIADAINEAGETYYGAAAKGWASSDGKVQRVYFGRDFVTIDADGNIHADKPGKARAQTCGVSGVELVEKFAE